VQADNDSWFQRRQMFYQVKTILTHSCTQPIVPLLCAVRAFPLFSEDLPSTVHSASSFPHTFALTVCFSKLSPSFLIVRPHPFHHTCCAIYKNLQYSFYTLGINQSQTFLINLLQYPHDLAFHKSLLLHQ